MKHGVFISRLLLAYLEEHLSHSVLTVALCNKIVALCQDRSSSKPANTFSLLQIICVKVGKKIIFHICK